MRRNKANLRIPTPAEFEAFDGGHCATIYRGLAQDWRCPACGRTTFQVMRWAMRFPYKPTRFEGWVGGYHKHHDHGVDAQRIGAVPIRRAPRFDEVTICEQCNSADGQAKRRLGLPADFSFSPSEIGRFVTATNHGSHAIDFEMAATIYRDRYF